MTQLDTPDLPFSNITIVGAGLIGTSLALALAENSIFAQVEDRDERRAEIVRAMISQISVQKGSIKRSSIERTNDHLVIVATPPATISQVIKEYFERDPQAKFIEISGIKSELQQEVKGFMGTFSHFLSVHPMAGREMNGPEAARADLFAGRLWINSPHEETDPQLLAASHAIASILGAYSIELSIKDHDTAITLVSQLPQLASSALGSLLEGREKEAYFAGQGLRDMVRLAGSEVGMWSELFDRNREYITLELNRYIDKLIEWRTALAEGDKSSIADLMNSGSRGREILPGKHGGARRNYASISVIIDDRAGQLGDLFAECAKAEINVEDLSIEHSPGLQTGLITLYVNPDGAEHLVKHLTDNGWKAY
jgi:prephenate dehydrogenase